MDENGLKSNRQSAHFGDCVVCFKNNIEKNPGSIIIPAKKYNKTFKKIKKIKKIAGSIIGPAMAGPTGPFATALQVVIVRSNVCLLCAQCRHFGYDSNLISRRRLIFVVTMFHMFGFNPCDRAGQMFTV